jgi:nucleoside-diphosphate-sugar epimerase
MKCVVTGAAGFIGSHLCEELLRRGHEVTGIDAFIPYYPEAVKLRNLQGFAAHPRFRFCRLDLRTDALEGALEAAEVVFHLAAMAGLTKSWTDFDGYWSCNVLATRRLLEAMKGAGGRAGRLVYGSTSSVYGLFGSGDEQLPTRPASPYGVTKLAGEHLCHAYAEAFGVRAVVLRYFSVYGPRQRPDMGYHRFLLSLLTGEPLVVYGDGNQARGNTYVSDCVAATVAAAAAPAGETYNVGGGEAASVWDILRALERITGRKCEVRREPARAGDQRYTFADTGKLRRHFGWEPKVRLDEGLARQYRWQKEELRAANASPATPPGGSGAAR